MCPALPLTGVFHVNLEEAASLAGKIYPLLDRAKQVSELTSAEDVITLEEVQEVAEILLAMGPGMVLVSLGCNGITLFTSLGNSQTYMSPLLQAPTPQRRTRTLLSIGGASWHGC